MRGYQAKKLVALRVRVTLWLGRGRLSIGSPLSTHQSPDHRFFSNNCPIVHSSTKVLYPYTHNHSLHMIFALTDSDRIALSMLTMILLALGTVGLLTYSIYRSSKKLRNPEDDLMDEVTEESRSQKSPTIKTSPLSPTGEREDWEKDPEWWKT